MPNSVGAAHGCDVRYDAVAVALHWAIAGAILANLAVGWWMHRAIDVAETQARAIAAYQLHKSIGLTVLALSLLRLGWRLTHRPPALPDTVARWQRVGSRLVHWAFYALMVAVPLSGWLYVSVQWHGDTPLSVPTLWFGLFEVPHLFGLNELAHGARRRLAAPAFGAHAALAWSMAGLFVLHSAAALRHHFADRDAVLARMRPGAGLAIVAVLGLAIVAGLIAPAVGVQRRAAVTSAPGGWTVDAASEIAFAGVHAGLPFRGRFLRWQADLRFNPLAAKVVTVAATVDTASASDGVPLHDESLPLPEWFDVARYPQARFVATRIAPKPGGGHTVEGALTIKDRIIPVPPLDLSLDNDTMTVSGRFTVDRADANLGMESDPDAEYVSRRIEVQVNVRATRPD